MRVPATVRLALILLLIALVFPVSYHHWLATRTWVALDMPVSLSRGHTKTGDFKINFNEPYLIELTFQEDLFRSPENCPRWQEGVVLTRSNLYRNGRPIGQQESDDFRLGTFDSEAGVYNIELEVFSDASCLDAGNPRLRVATHADFGALSTAISWLSIVLLAVGISLLIQFFAIHLEKPSRPPSLTDSETPTLAYQRSRELCLRPIVSSLPSFGLIGSMTILMIFLPCWIIYAWQQPYLKGLVFYVLPQAMTQNKTMHWAEGEIGIDIYVGLSDRWYLNSKPIASVDLPAALRSELSRRADGVVYVEGDPDVNVEEVARAMDIVIGLHAKPVLLTPQTRKELQNARSPQRFAKPKTDRR